MLAATWDPEGAEPPTPVPWSEVLTLAHSQGVAPLLHAAIRRTGTEAPEPVRTALAQDYYGVARANTLRTQELQSILAALSAAGVPVLLVKGMALAERLYANIALRPMSDFDLIVPRQDVPACQVILTGLGYRPIETEFVPGAFMAYRNELAFTPPEASQAPVELHWHLLDVPYYLRKVPLAWFWENTEVCEIARHQVHVLNAEANLPYLASHLAFHHRFHGLRWFVDLAVLTHRYKESLDWDRVLSQAQEFELLLAVRAILDRLAGYWPSLPLDEPRRLLHGLKPTPAEQRLFRLLTAEPRGTLLDLYTDLYCLPDFPARARFAYQNVFPQPAYMTRRYGMRHGWQLPFYYIYRLGDGLAKLARALPQIAGLRRGLP
jgi:hypothetical protein